MEIIPWATEDRAASTAHTHAIQETGSKHVRKESEANVIKKLEAEAGRRTVLPTGLVPPRSESMFSQQFHSRRKTVGCIIFLWCFAGAIKSLDSSRAYLELQPSHMDQNVAQTGEKYQNHGQQ